MVAKACLAQFDTVEALRHLWPMVRSEGHLDRVLDDVERRPGLVLYTLVNPTIRRDLERKCRRRGIHAVSVLDPVIDALAALSGEEAKGRAGRQHALDAAYFARVDAIQFTIAHDDGVGAENWEEADIVLAGVSRTSKTPTSIYLANRGYKVANIPLVPRIAAARHPVRPQASDGRRPHHQSRAADPDPPQPAAVAQPGAGDRLCRCRGGQCASSPSRGGMFADNGWPVIDVTRRSIEETALAIVKLCTERAEQAAG